MKTIKSSQLIAVARVRSQRCAFHNEGCTRKARLAVTFPTREPDSDVVESSCVVLCGDHIEGAIVNLAAASRKDGTMLFPYVGIEALDGAIIEALARLTLDKEETDGS